jgi:chromosome segregation ATPase
MSDERRPATDAEIQKIAKHCNDTQRRGVTSATLSIKYDVLPLLARLEQAESERDTLRAEVERLRKELSRCDENHCGCLGKGQIKLEAPHE